MFTAQEEQWRPESCKVIDSVLGVMLMVFGLKKLNI